MVLLEANITWVDTAAKVLGVLTFVWVVIQYILNKSRRQASANLSKTEREVEKHVVEKYLVELNVNELIKKEANLIEDKYKDIIFNMQREHFEIKKDMQGRLEKEMKLRIEAEQDNEILKNELHLIKEKSEDQDRKIEELTTKVKQLEKLKNK